jgi:hypothetical protein
MALGGSAAAVINVTSKLLHPRRTRLAGLLTLGTTTVTLALGASPAAATTQIFGYTGGEQVFVVPNGIHKLKVRIVGGGGGEGGGQGGRAAELLSGLEVTPGQTLYVEVGGNGKDSGAGSSGGFNGGAPGGGGAGGGGGASDIRLLPRSEGLTIDTRLVVAAGGGGGAGDGENAGGGGGDAEESGGTSEGGNEGGGGGTASAGGSGGSGCSLSGTAGERGSGGAGGAGFSTNSGGGGGGGLYGGGGGGGGCAAGGGGGGGGSSLVPLGSLEVLAVGEPEIEISYIPPPDINIAVPAANASYSLGQSVPASYSCSAHEPATLVKCAGSVASGAPLDTSTLGQHSFTVDAEDNSGGTSSQTVKYTVLAPAAPPPPSGSTAPDTLLGRHPGKRVKTAKKRVKVKFTFSSPTAGATFKCKLDNAQFAPCASPKTYKVKAGKHKFSVEAVGGGLTDPTPATFSFKVIRTS